MPEFCPKCFWIQWRARKIPYQLPFPGIFSSIDSHIKKVVHGFHAREGKLPLWYPDYKGFKAFAKIPARSEFRTTDPSTSTTLTGMPDEVLELKDGTFHIVDYKTAKKTQTQDGLFPIYDVQLNGYAYIGERTAFPGVSGISLVYVEPMTDLGLDERPLAGMEPHLLLDFKLTRVDVKLRPDELIPPLLQKATELYALEEPPARISACENCNALDELLMLISR